MFNIACASERSISTVVCSDQSLTQKYESTVSLVHKAFCHMETVKRSVLWIFGETLQTGKGYMQMFYSMLHITFDCERLMNPFPFLSL